MARCAQNTCVRRTAVTTLREPERYSAKVAYRKPVGVLRVYFLLNCSLEALHSVNVQAQLTLTCGHCS